MHVARVDGEIVMRHCLMTTLITLSNLQQSYSLKKIQTVYNMLRLYVGGGGVGKIQLLDAGMVDSLVYQSCLSNLFSDGRWSSADLPTEPPEASQINRIGKIGQSAGL